VHLDLFGQNMDYKKSRDQQHVEMARLSLLNQGLLVHAIDRLADAIGGRLPPRPPHSGPHSQRTTPNADGKDDFPPGFGSSTAAQNMNTTD